MRMNNFFAELGSGAIPWYAIAIAAIGAYFLGNINPAILIGRAKGIDIRARGSGNAGATNALRSLGKKAGAATFVIDVVKGWAGYYVPLVIFLRLALGDERIFIGLASSQLEISSAAYAAWTAASYAPAMLCGLCVMLGHMYPAVFGFRGGKGVSTVFGVLLAASWLYALILLAVVLVFTAVFRRVSLAVLIAVAAALVLVFAPFGLAIARVEPLWIIILLAFVVWKHRGNIKRLFKGEEPKLSFGSGSGGSGDRTKGDVPCVLQGQRVDDLSDESDVNGGGSGSGRTKGDVPCVLQGQRVDDLSGGSGESGGSDRGSGSGGSGESGKSSGSDGSGRSAAPKGGE